MYKVYVIKQRAGGSEVLHDTKTQTNSFPVACFAFWELYDLPLNAQHLILMSKNKKQINAYRYASQKGERDYLNKEMELKDDV